MFDFILTNMKLDTRKENDFFKIVAIKNTISYETDWFLTAYTVTSKILNIRASLVPYDNGGR